jgi:hypothetical protein
MTQPEDVARSNGLIPRSPTIFDGSGESEWTIPRLVEKLRGSARLGGCATISCRVMSLGHIHIQKAVG